MRKHIIRCIAAETAPVLPCVGLRKALEKTHSLPGSSSTQSTYTYSGSLLESMQG